MIKRSLAFIPSPDYCPFSLPTALISNILALPHRSTWKLCIIPILQYRKLSPEEVGTLAEGFGVSGPGPLVPGLPLVPSTRVAVLRGM